MSSLHFHKLTIKNIRQETPDCVSISFDIPEDLQATFAYTAGQYLTLKTELNAAEVRRSYSICSSNVDRELRVAIKRVEGGKFSNYAFDNMKVGDVIDVMPPLGKFSPKNITESKKNYLAFAAGSGITPIMSIMKDVLHNVADATFTLVYGNRNRGSIIFKEEIEALKNIYMERLRVYHVLSKEVQDAPLFNGHIDAIKVAGYSGKLIDYTKIDEIFVCGPESMILGLKDYFLNEGNKMEDAIHFELFTSPDQPKVSSADWVKKVEAIDRTKVAKITVKLDSSSFDMDLAYAGESILDAALQQGADLPFACKGGVCCTCKCKVLEGEVDMEVNYGLEPDEIANNYILSCQAHPRSEKVVVDFDV